MTARISFHVDGNPVPQGTTRSFAKNGRVITTNDPSGRLERWRGDIRQAAKATLPAGFAPLDGPLALSVRFSIQRPRSHYLPVTRSRPEPVLRPGAPVWCAGKPDIDRLVRAVLDALALVVYRDDAQIVSFGVVEKRWATFPGASVDIVERLA